MELNYLDIMGFASTFLGVIGSIASIVSFYASTNLHATKLSKVMMCISITSISIAIILSIQYQNVVRASYQRSAKIIELSITAEKFIRNNPPLVDYETSGASEGLARAGLAILEIYKEILPDTYIDTRKQIECDTVYAKDSHNPETIQKSLNHSAQTITKLFDTLSRMHDTKNQRTPQIEY